MHAWEQVQKTIDFIETHLGEEISIDSLAKIAARSPFYYQRLFHRLVKKPVAEYIKLRRLAKATEALLQKDQRILDVALSLGFSSHEHFTRRFKDSFGMTPEEYRSNPQTLSRMTKPELMLQYTLVDEGVLPPGLTSWDLPQGEYIACTFEAESFEALVMDVLYKAEQYLYQTWLPSHQLQTEPFAAERYENHLPQVGKMEIWLKLAK